MLREAIARRGIAIEFENPYLVWAECFDADSVIYG
jgi:hypothetical protein